ncbi:IclR family transcriptional regulator domain-containing protein [Rhizobium straminoryzae]|uniref:DNA-binding transcriptional regulator KdgR n=1 Tax=Rhizobium straminoryzae TaxID=1387186 RepID=A0A549THS6_9HYPH|nr:IclR family transcriptional regulator C-terminal domain-containing protein [Rhizobium straminoryzae]TRL42660.1 DNA-binding transcriptional regulator KdgR [Rhizobium straminoryzae]
MPDSQSRPEQAAAVLKVFAVLEALAGGRRSSLAELAERAATSKTTAHRLLQTMVDLGYVEQDADTEKYGLTLRLFSLAARSLHERDDLLRAADGPMGRLSRATGESINLGVLDAREQKVVYIHKYDSAFGLSMTSTLGLRNPLHSTALGKALLAFLDEDEMRERLARMVLEPRAPRTITNPQLLLAELQATRARGYAEEMEESEAGVRCMAIPVFDHLRKPVAAISISFPLLRFDEARKDDYIRLLTECGLAASTALGFRSI